MGTQRQIKLLKRPVGLPGDEIWSLEESPIPELEEGQVKIKVLYASIDPAMRGWLNDVRSYIPPVQIGEVMRALALGQVIDSKDESLSVGAYVVGTFGWQEIVCVPVKHLTEVYPSVAPLTAWLGVLGVTGLSAWFGLLEVGEPVEGETVLVSGAAGAVGSIVGQIARIKGCRVVGIAGGPKKCARLVDDFGFAAAIDYKRGDLDAQLRDACPEGVDVFFDNVGGDTLDAALRRINRGARVVICGAISTYNATSPPKGPANYLSLLVNRARMEGFIVFDYVDRYPEAIQSLAGWLATGQIKHCEHIVDGLENAPAALRMLFSGANQGKLILKIADP